MSQQASYKAEIHELYAEMLNVRKKTEMQAARSAKVCRLEQPSITVEAEPENVLNTASLLASELMTQARPATGGMQTPTGQPVQFGPSPETQQYSRRHDLSVPPVQWGGREFRDAEEEGCELFGSPVQPGGEQPGDPDEYIIECRGLPALQDPTTTRVRRR